MALVLELWCWRLRWAALVWASTKHGSWDEGAKRTRRWWLVARAAPGVPVCAGPGEVSGLHAGVVMHAVKLIRNATERTHRAYSFRLQL